MKSWILDLAALHLQMFSVRSSKGLCWSALEYLEYTLCKRMFEMGLSWMLFDV